MDCAYIKPILAIAHNCDINSLSFHCPSCNLLVCSLCSNLLQNIGIHRCHNINYLIYWKDINGFEHYGLPNLSSDEEDDENEDDENELMDELMDEFDLNVNIQN